MVGWAASFPSPLYYIPYSLVMPDSQRHPINRSLFNHVKNIVVFKPQTVFNFKNVPYCF